MAGEGGRGLGGDALTIIRPGVGVHPLTERIRVAGLADLAREME